MFYNIAVCLKTGADTIETRLPTQLATFLAPIGNLLIVSNHAGYINSGGKQYEVVDVVSGLYERVRKTLRLVPPVTTATATKAVSNRKKASERTAGWRDDAHKNLPAFQMLAEQFPDAQWYFMIDDDSYVDFANLAAFLETQDPNTPLYLGRSNIFKGCDGVKKFRDGPDFAQGGGGILLSRAAMKIVYGGLNACILRYETCWAGDVRVGLCMRDAGIRITQNTSFFSSGIHENIGFPADPCVRPFTFHHADSDTVRSIFVCFYDN
ncbi:hypothetical protein HDU84_007289 [Entophlyctis sp. JEL0112]|nr:hypothetical protein HDU84_007289 [Entophlyctis sp. JEL0112]